MAKNCQMQRDFVAAVVRDDDRKACTMRTMRSGVVVGYVRKSHQEADTKTIRRQLYESAFNWLERMGYDDSHLPALTEGF